MEESFWQQRWDRQEIGFHQEEVNPWLMKYFSALGLAGGDSIFVPLCGKSLDMLWLRDQGLSVTGVELSGLAIEQLFNEHAMKARCQKRDSFTLWETHDLQVLQGNFFDLRKKMLEGTKAVYDRASLIALPPDMRKAYRDHMLKILPGNARILLITLEYNQSEMDGPPFSVSEREVASLYEQHYDIKELGSEDVLAVQPVFRERGLSRLEQKAWLLNPHRE